MYHDFYELELLPFENTPDPRFFFASEQHREALAAMEYTIRMRKGIVVITGDIGSGKTTIGRAMCDRCNDHATIVRLFHGHRTADELLAHLLRHIGLEVGNDEDHARKLERLERHLRHSSFAERPLVLFVDEAQTLSDEALEELRLLTNFDTNTHKLLQLVLVGQPELRDRLREPRFNALRQRIVMAKQLRPMNRQETGQYLAHRIVAASRNRQQRVWFTPEAIDRLHAHSQGIPRLINVLADNCLLMGFVRETRTINHTIVAHVVQDMVPSFEVPTTNTQAPLHVAGGF